MRNVYIIVKGSNEETLNEQLQKRLSMYDKPIFRIINMECVAGIYQMYVEIEDAEFASNVHYVRDTITVMEGDSVDFNRKVAEVNKKYIRDGYQILETIEERRFETEYTTSKYISVVQRRAICRKEFC